MSGHRRNIPLLYAFQFLSALAFYLPVAALYFIQIGGSARSAMLVFAVMNVTAALCDIPTGAFADTAGRKICFVVGALFSIAGVACYAMAHSLWLLLAGGALAGIGNALTTGVGMALLYDSLRDMKRETDFKRVNAILQTAFPLGLAISSLVGGVIAQELSLRWTAVATLVPTTLLLPTALLLREPAAVGSADATVLHKSVRTALHILRGRELLLLFAIGMFGWSLAQAMFNGSPLFYVEAGLTPASVGAIQALTFGMSMVGMLLSPSLSDRIGDKATLYVSIVAQVALWMLATTLRGNALIVPLAISSLAFALRIPVEHHLTNLLSPHDARATLLSTKSLLDRVMIAAASLAWGYAADAISATVAVRLLTAVMAVNLIFVLLMRIPKHQHRQS